jgi:hypothetical protein
MSGWPLQGRPARAWWPGRTDEVRRVADRIRAMPDEEYDAMTMGELAARCSADVFIVEDAIDMNNRVADALAAHFAGLKSPENATGAVRAPSGPAV